MVTAVPGVTLEEDSEFGSEIMDNGIYPGWKT